MTVIRPLGYIEFLSPETEAAAVLTDSGGVQEETTYLGVPCFTLRSTTERPITISHGTNTLLGLDPDRISDIPSLLASTDQRDGRRPPLWDGSAASRLVDVLLRFASCRDAGELGQRRALSASRSWAVTFA